MDVLKRDGRSEKIDLDKIHKVLVWAEKDLDVSVSQVEIDANIQFYPNITTETIHRTLVNAAANLISEESPDYQYLAARLRMFAIRKEAYGEFNPPNLKEHYEKLAELGVYTKELSEYTTEEWEKLNEALNHTRDMDYAYAAINQLEGKYLVQDRVSGRIYESPQMALMLIGMCLFMKDVDRVERIIEFYEAVSTFKISLPTPIMAGVRTPTKQFSSCVKIEAGDSLDSISEASKAIIKYVSQRAGIGLNVGSIRALGSEIRGGEAIHTGLIPFLKLFQAAVKSCSQGGVRGGAATLFYPLWHLEVESLLVLKNNRGVEENRVRQMDYGVQLNRLMYERLISDGDITLLSPHSVEGLYEAFFTDQKLFKELYEKAEQDNTVVKKTIKARELFSLLMQERASTGRIYVQNVDHCNTHSAFNPAVAPIRMSNLCVEIALPTEPLEADGSGEVALCTLGAINVGIVNQPEDIEQVSKILVRALDNLLDYQDYPLKAAEKAGKGRRALGIGVINFANYLAQHGYSYTHYRAPYLTHQLFEGLQYYLLKASMELAAERGACDKYSDTSYSQGILPIDTYNENVDEVCDLGLVYDWEGLRRMIDKYGLRNSTLTAQMPSETSSQISNATNGIEPPRGLVSVKTSKDGVLKQVVPDINKVEYELLWDIKDNKHYLQLVAIMQKFIDQTISVNTNYDPSRYESGRVPMTVLLQDLLTAYKLGIKTLYYHNTRDGQEDPNECISCKI